MEYSQDMFNQIVQDYDQLKARAEEIFNIRGKYFDHRGYVESIELDQNTVEITTSYTCCGDTDTEYYSFPSAFLLMADAELEDIFAAEKNEANEKLKREQEERDRKERERIETRERAELARLFAKYGGKTNVD